MGESVKPGETEGRVGVGVESLPSPAVTVRDGEEDGEERGLGLRDTVGDTVREGEREEDRDMDRVVDLDCVREGDWEVDMLRVTDTL